MHLLLSGLFFAHVYLLFCRVKYYRQSRWLEIIICYKPLL